MFDISIVRMAKLCLFVASLIHTNVASADNVHQDSGGRGYCISVPEGDILDFFSSYGLDFPIASAVRGGVFPDWIPEMSMASFDKVVETLPAIIEVKPNISTDGTIFLLPDVTLDRTTTGFGPAHIQDWSALSNLQLVDNVGRITQERIPTLQQALEWAEGKTILQINLLNEFIGLTPGLAERVVEMINSLGAHDRVMMISWSNEQAKAIYDLDYRLPIAVFSLDPSSIEAAEALGIPTRNIVPTLSFDIDPDYAEFLAARHRTPAYITYFLESSDISVRQAKRTYRELWQKGMVIQASTRLKDFSEAFKFGDNKFRSPYLRRGCLMPSTNPTCEGQVATIVGTDAMDVIVGTQDRDVIVALGGDDIITGGKGDDLVCGGPGNDIIYSGDGRDRIFGQEDNDILYGGDNKDVIEGGSGFDIIDGGRGEDVCNDWEQVKRCSP